MDSTLQWLRAVCAATARILFSEVEESMLTSLETSSTSLESVVRKVTSQTDRRTDDKLQPRLGKSPA